MKFSRLSLTILLALFALSCGATKVSASTHIPLTITRFDGGSGTVLVSDAIPLTPGLLFPSGTANVALFVNGVEQPIYTEVLAGRQPDGSLRSLLIEFNYNVPSGGTTGELVIGSPRTTTDIAKPTTNRGIPVAAALPTDPNYLIGTDLVGPTITEAASSALGGAFTKYESDFAQFADYQWNFSGADWAAGDYYDRAFIYYAMWVRTGNPVYWDRGNKMAVNFRQGYLEANNFLIQQHEAQMEGIDAHYALTGEDASRLAVLKLADWFYDGISTYYAFGDMSASDDRIRARYLTDFLFAWRLNPTGSAQFGSLPSETYVKILNDALDQIVATQGADGADRFGGDCGGTKSFMNGQMNDALIRYYRIYSADARIPTYMKKSVDYLWTLWDPATQGLEYASVYCINPSGDTDATTSFPDLNNLIVNGFAFTYAHTGDSTYLSRADQMFTASVNTAWLYGSKQFNQEYTSSFSYLALRNGSSATPLPPSPPPSDTTAPSVPTNLSASAVSQSQINLSWTASMDDTSVAGYRVFRNGTQIATPTTNSFSDTNLSPSTLYSYTIAAVDTSGNISAQSSPNVSATTQAAQVVTPPPPGSFPNDPILWLKLDESSGTIAADSSGGSNSATVSGASFVAGKLGNALSFNGTNNFATLNNSSLLDFGNAQSFSIALWFKTTDSTTPRLISNGYSGNSTGFRYQLVNGHLDAGIAGSSSGASLRTTNTYNDGAWHLGVAVFDQTAKTITEYIDGTAVTGTSVGTCGTVSGTTLNYSGCSAVTATHGVATTIGSYTGSAEFLNGLLDDIRVYNRPLSASEVSALFTGNSSTPSPDTTAPSVPQSISVTAVSNQVSLSWTASTDNVAVTGYKVFRNGTQIGTSNSLSFNDANIAASIPYSYKVSAIDAAGNESAQSTAASITVAASIPAAVVSTGGGGGGGGGTSVSTTYTSVSTGGGGGGGGSISTPDTTYQDLLKAITALVLQNKTLLLKAEAQGITLSPLILQILQSAGGTTTTTTSSTGYSRDLTLGSKGSDVTELQTFLINQNKGPEARALGKNGATGYFGSLTKFALAEYQYSAGISPATGYFGPVTRGRVGY